MWQIMSLVRIYCIHVQQKLTKDSKTTSKILSETAHRSCVQGQLCALVMSWRYPDYFFCTQDVKQFLHSKYSIIMFTIGNADKSIKRIFCVFRVLYITQTPISWSYDSIVYSIYVALHQNTELTLSVWCTLAPADSNSWTISCFPEITASCNKLVF